MPNTLMKAQYLLISLVGVYILFLLLLTIPSIQRELIFLHHVKLPSISHFDTPEIYGLAPLRTRNFYLNTTDGQKLGVWHILPQSIYQTSKPFPPETPLSKDIFEAALIARPTIIYFHGNAVTRAALHRVRGYSAFSTRLDCNVLAVDYRGFGDSSGTPSEEGLMIDAKTVWDYVISTIVSRRSVSTSGNVGAKTEKWDGISPEKMVILVGQSLGTGVVSGLAGIIGEQGLYPRALVLIAPFTSLSELLLDYKLATLIPILSPFKAVPSLQKLLLSFLQYQCNSVAALAKTESPILILHSKDDNTIPHSHSASIFASLLQTASTKINEIQYTGWGTVRSFTRIKAEVVWWEGDYGGHNRLGWSEGTMDLIARVSKLEHA